MFVGRHDTDAIRIEVNESKDGNLRMLLNEAVQKLPCFDVWIAFGLKLNQDKLGKVGNLVQ
jgi:hypothetical protein